MLYSSSTSYPSHAVRNLNFDINSDESASRAGAVAFLKIPNDLALREVGWPSSALSMLANGRSIDRGQGQRCRRRRTSLPLQPVVTTLDPLPDAVCHEIDVVNLTTTHRFFLFLSFQNLRGFVRQVVGKQEKSKSSTLVTHLRHHINIPVKSMISVPSKIAHDSYFSPNSSSIMLHV